MKSGMFLVRACRLEPRRKIPVHAFESIFQLGMRILPSGLQYQQAGSENIPPAGDGIEKNRVAGESTRYCLTPPAVNPATIRF